MAKINRNSISVTVKLIDVLNAPLMSAWSLMCEKYRINEYCINEGLADNESTIEISLEDAELYGLIEDNKTN